MNNSDMPAAPCKVEVNEQMKALGMASDFYARGLTKREHFAAMAISSVLDKYNPYDNGDFDSSDWDCVAQNAVGIADALIKELAK
jgi:hypothetical protein